MVIQFNVTQDEIDRGTRGDCRACPIALAANRLLRGDVAVSHLAITVYSCERLSCERLPATHFRAEIPLVARHFILLFDIYGPARVRPFAFPLDIPDESPPAEPANAHGICAAGQSGGAK